MSGYKQYLNELESGVKGNSKEFKKEILESFSEIEDISDKSYTQLVSTLGKPVDFISEFLANRIIKPKPQKKSENKLLLKTIRVLNFVPSFFIFLYLFVIPFYENTDIYDKKTAYQLASDQFILNWVIGPILILLQIGLLEFFQRKLLFENIQNLIEYFEYYVKYFVSTLGVYFWIQFVFLHSAYQNLLEDHRLSLSWTFRNNCADYGLSCTNVTSMWNLMQWLVLWMVAIQLISVLLTMFYRLNRNGIAFSEFEQIENVELDVSRYPQRIKWIYKFNFRLLVFGLLPIIIFLIFNHPDDLDSRPQTLIIIIGLMFVLAIIIQFLYYSGLAYSSRSLSDEVKSSEYSCRSNAKYHLGYGIYFLLTPLLDLIAKTDGFLIFSGIISLIFVLGMWAVETRNPGNWILILLITMFSSIFVMMIIAFFT